MTNLDLTHQLVLTLAWIVMSGVVLSAADTICSQEDSPIRLPENFRDISVRIVVAGAVIVLISGVLLT